MERAFIGLGTRRCVFRESRWSAGRCWGYCGTRAAPGQSVPCAPRKPAPPACVDSNNHSPWEIE